ncbi:MAG: 50S ribosomal protein L1 [Euryarchaeota archaeon]|mgnify:CR=1 FL=1|nr:50S ribosomal protein L1 [Euryarchaeota archaeon]
MVEEITILAVKRALESSPERNFRQSVDLAINLKDVDLSNPKNRIQEDIVLPHGRGKSLKVCVIGGAELAEKAKGVADLIITPEELGEIADDKTQAKKVASQMDFFIAEAPLMPQIGRRLGIVLAPRGKMPKPIPPGADPEPMIESLRRTVSIRTRDKRTFQAPVGTVDMTPEELAENVDAVLKRVASKLEKGNMNIDSAYVKTTMGPAEKVL